MGRKPFHIKPDVQNLDCDFYVFQDTKCGPTGIGILYGKESWLNKLHIKVEAK
jgi:cysteine desulfurase/selenocysteine lyase